MVRAVDVAGTLGAALFEMLEPGAAAQVRDVALAADGAETACHTGDLVLGSSTNDLPAARELITRCVAGRASGLILRLPLAADPGLLEAARATGLTLIGLRSEVSWTHAVWLLRDLLDRSPTPGSSEAGPHAGLFALADAAAAILNAPVTIEDERSRVLAYSFGQDAADPTRVSTIIGRRVPAELVAHYRASGVFRRMARSDEPFLTPPAPDGTRPRLVIPVRAGDEWLGSIWAVSAEPVEPGALPQLRSAAAAVAMHLLRVRAQADVASRESTERLRRLLRETVPGNGSPDAPGPWRVAALGAGQDELPVALDLWRATLRRHGWARPSLADVDGTVFALLTERGVAGSWPWLQRTIDELHRADPTLHAAAGEIAARTDELPRSRRQADELFGVFTGAGAGPAALSVEDGWAQLTLARAAATVDADRPCAALRVLREHDAANDTEYLTTLRAWLRHPAQPLVAAGELHLHVNTLRYRMGRLGRLVDLDLEDATVRLALQIQLAALAPVER